MKTLPNPVPSRSIEEMIPLLVQVQRDLDEELNLDTLARRFGYSPFHFHRRFKEVVGETPRQYVQRLRLEKAAYKLQITNASVLDISLAVGFQNHETFTRAFRQHFGCAPSRYRQEGRMAQAERLRRKRSFRGDEPPRRFAWSVDVKETASTALYTLDEADEGTKVTLEVEHRLKGFFMKFMSPFIRWHLKSERAKEMERLRKALEEL